MKNFTLFGIFIFVLAGCQSLGWSFIEIRDSEQDYQQTTLNWSSGSKMIIRMKPTNENGFLGVCGYFIGDGGLQGSIEAVYLRNAYLAIGDKRFLEDVSFLSEHKKGRHRYSASCVKTQTPFLEQHRYSRIKLIGPRSVTYVH